MLTETDGRETFGDAVEKLLSLVECRMVTSVIDREAIYRLRYDAYLREGAVAPSDSRAVFDRFDELANTYTYGFYIDGELASSLRLSVADCTTTDIPATTVFADVLEPAFRAGRTILDPTRFVLDAEQARRHPKLLYVTLRLAWLATEHFKVDDTLASVRTEHQAFYRRFYGHKLLCPARTYPSLIKPLSLMSLDFAPSRERGLRRYPFLRSTKAEREQLCGARSPAFARATEAREPMRIAV